MVYSLDLRKKALEHLEKGKTEKECAATFGVTRRTLSNWKRRQREQNLAPKVRRLSPSKIDRDRLRQYIHDHPDAYLRELKSLDRHCKRFSIHVRG